MRVTTDATTGAPGGSAATTAAEPVRAEALGEAGPEDDELNVMEAGADDDSAAEAEDEVVFGTSRGVSADSANRGAASIVGVGASRSTGGSTCIGGAVGVGGAAISMGFADGFGLTSGRGGLTGCGAGAGGVGASLTMSSVTIRLVRGGGGEAGTRLSAP